MRRRLGLTRCRWSHFRPAGSIATPCSSGSSASARRWYIAFSGSSLLNVLVAVEAGLGLSLLPIEATAGRRLRPYAPLGQEPAIVVSLYSWEKNGPIAALVQSMRAVLAERFNTGGQA
jgi:DNA-binding transcriptional LysR family regulator